MADPLRARLTALLAALETQGYRAFPCATCHREGDMRVHDLHELLAALLPEPPEPASPAVVAMNALCQRPPWEFYGVYDNERCFFCGRDRSSNRDLSLDEEGQHEVDCAWWLWRQTAARAAAPEEP